MPYQSNITSNVKTYKREYKDFKGVDFTSVVTEVDFSRSPDAVNVIGDYAGMPEKRTGYIDLGYDFGGQRINGLFQYVTPQNIKYILVHAGTTLYRIYPENESAIVQPQPPTSYIYLALVPDGEYEATPIYTDMNNNRSTSFVMNGNIYFLDGVNYLEYDGETCQKVENIAKVPKTTIAAKPTGGGESYEPFNLLTPKAINSFAGDGTSKTYTLDRDNITSVDKVTVNGSTVTEYTVNLQAGTITFTTAPSKPEVTGEDNVEITYSKVIQGYPERITKCCINTFFGINNDTRVFVTGNPDYINRDYYSESLDPTFFPDINYSVIGSENTAIMGYVKQYGDLVIVKQSNSQDASMYLRSATTDGEGNALFTVTQGIVGIGAASRYTFADLYDDTIFLANEGVFGLDTSSVTLQKTTQLRSHYVNAKLAKEAGKYEAFACVLNNNYYLFINNHVYIADAMQRNNNVSKSYGYEWYYWEDIPARCAMEFENELYFGTPDGRLCKMKSVQEYGTNAYSDDYYEIVDGINVLKKHSYLSRWSTRVDTCEDASSYKRIEKGNIGLLIKPADNNKVKILYKTNKGEKDVKEYQDTRTIDFEYIDFSNFNFGGDSDSPYFIATNKKDRKCKTFQMIFENNEINSTMGLIEIHFKYSIGNRIK